MLIERNKCIFDASQLAKSHGFENLDAVAQEAFVNHIHLDGVEREERAAKIVDVWANEMRAKWPASVFRIYMHRDEHELTLRFHRHRPELPDRSNEGEYLIIMTIGRTN